MPFLSFLSVLPVLGFVYTICFIAREERAKIARGGSVPSAMPLRDTQVSLLGRRQIKWLSPREFQAMSSRSDDLILIALRKKTEAKPIPFPESHVLYAEPDRLIDLLRWLPPSSGAVLYGTSNRLFLTASEVRNLTGSAPIYLTCERSE